MVKHWPFPLKGMACSTSYHLILVGGPLEHTLGSLDVQQDIGKDTDGILVTPHHKICKAHIVVGGDLAFRHPGVHTLGR